MTTLEVLDPRFASVARGAGRLQRLCTGAIWSEGPVWTAESGALLWSDIPNNRMLSWHAERGMTVWRDAVEFTNGHVRQADGALLHCLHGLRAIARTRLDDQGQPIGEDEVLVSHYQRKRLNSPNDVVVKTDLSIWFTDPPYGILSNYKGHQATSELGRKCVFRFDPATADLQVVSDLMEEPNGLAFSPDERVLYVSDTSAALRTDGSGNHHIMAFNVVNEWALSNPLVFAVITPGLSDGFRIDVQGFVYTSSADSV